jgi:ribonuclease VapC
VVLDASALLAHLRGERGATAVADAIGRGASISAVNLAEVLSRAADRGADPGRLAADLTEDGLLGGAIAIEPFTPEDATLVASLRLRTRDAGLSLGDRACLALAGRLGLPALTGDTAWSELDVEVDVRLFR